MLVSARKLSKFARLLMIAGLIVACSDATAQTKRPIVIGSLWSQTGAAAQYGIAEREAVAALVEEINKANGIDGHPIQVVNFDEATNPVEAARGATHLIQQHNVVAVMGASTGSGTLAAAPILARAKVPIISPNATATVTSKDHAFYPWIFRSVVGDRNIIEALAERIAASGAKKIGMFYAEDAYGQDAFKLISNLAPNLGLDVVVSSSAPANATDLAAQAVRLRNAAPDAIAIVTSSPVLAATFVKASKQVDLKASLWGGVGLGNKSFIDIGGPAAEGVNAILLANWDDPTPELARLGGILSKAGRVPQGIGEPIAATSLMILVHALRSDPTAKGEALRSAIEKTCNLEIFSKGLACFGQENHDGIPAEALVNVVIANGKFKTVK